MQHLGNVCQHSTSACAVSLMLEHILTTRQSRSSSLTRWPLIKHSCTNHTQVEEAVSFPSTQTCICTSSSFAALRVQPCSGIRVPHRFLTHRPSGQDTMRCQTPTRRQLRQPESINPSTIDCRRGMHVQQPGTTFHIGAISHAMRKHTLSPIPV